MAIGDLFSGGMLTSTVLLKMKVDTSDAKKGLKDLTGEEKKAAQAAIQLQEQKNKQMDSWAKGIAKVTVGMQLAQKAVSMLGDSWKAYEKAAMAAGGADAEKAKKFRDALTLMDQSINKISVAIGGLVAELAPLVQIAGGLVSVIAEGINLLNRGIGSLGPGRGESYEGQWAVDAAVGYTDAERALMAKFGIDLGGGGSNAASIAARKRLRAFQQIDQTNNAAWGAYGDNPWDLARQQEEERKRQEEAKKRGGGARAGWNMGQLDGMPFDAGRAMNLYTTRGEVNDRSGRFTFASPADDLGQAAGSGAGIPSLEMINKALAETSAFGREQEKKSIFEQIFGPPEEFDMYKMKLELMSDALSVFGGALQTNFDAWVDGSMSAGEAFKKFGTDVVSGMSKMLMATAIQEGVAAVVSLARYDFKGAAEHGKAAGMAAAGAVAVGAIARQIGGSGGASAGAGGGVPSVTGGGGIGAGSGGGSTTVILVGDGFSDESPAWRRQRSERTVRMGRAAMNQNSGVIDG